MYKLTKKFTFEAAHQLPNHDGKCARLHGHSWKGEIVVCAPAVFTTGPKTGMVVDYGDMKKAVAPLIEDYLDHHYLNTTLPVLAQVIIEREQYLDKRISEALIRAAENPTSESICFLLFEYLRNVAGLRQVSIEETCTSRCSYDGVFKC